MSASAAAAVALREPARWSGPRSAHFDGERFSYPGAPFDKRWRDVLRFLLERQRGDWSAPAGGRAPPTALPPLVDGEVQITPVHHASVLIRSASLTVLTDPIWSERASPVRWAGPKRRQAPGLAFEQLPAIDVVVISHNHYDHLDLPTLKRLAARDDPQFVVPAGNAALLRAAGIERIVELDWDQAWTAPDGCAIHALRARHWSARTPFDRNRSLWAAYLIETVAGPVYFAGDTGYDDQFLEVRRRFGPVRAALLPIGAYAPRWFMQWQHMDPQEAVRAHQDLDAEISIGIHFGAFELADDGPDEAPRALAQARDAAGLAATAFVPARPGVALSLPAPLAAAPRGCGA